MEIKLGKIDYTTLDRSVIFLYGSEVAARALPLKRDEAAYLEQRRKDDISSLVVFGRLPHKIYVQNFDSELPNSEALEKLRRAAAELQQTLSAEKVNVNANKRGGVSVDVRVRPRNTVDVTDEGRRLHDELSLGLASLCGDKVKHINLEFVEAESAVPAQDVSIEMLEIPQSVYERAALQDGSQQAGALDGSTASSPVLSDGGSQSYEVEGEGEQQ